MKSNEIAYAESGRVRTAIVINYAIAIGVGLAGLLMAHHPMILSGLRLVQTDLADPRLINYLLEHNYRWYRGDSNHSEFWHPPFFYPARNVAGYSDTFLGIAPLYALFRLSGFAYDTSFQLWLMALSVLNYVVMFHLLRVRMRLSILGAAAGAFVFAFGAPRVNRIATPQHLTHFLSLITIDALFGIFSEQSRTAWRRASLWFVAAASVIAQLTSGFYLGWFLVLALGIAAIVGIWLPSTRISFVATLWHDAPWIALSAIGGGLVLRSWVAHHRAAEFSGRYIPYVQLFLPRPSTWLYQGPKSWFGAWTAALTSLPYPSIEIELRLGLGIVTTLVCLAGLYAARERRTVRLLSLVAIVLFLCLTIMPPLLMDTLKFCLVLGSTAFAYTRRRENPCVFLNVVALVLLSLSITVIRSEPAIGFGLFTLLLAVKSWHGWMGNPRARLILGGLCLGLLSTLCPAAIVLMYGAVFGGLLAAIAAVLGWRQRSRVAAVAIVGLFLFVVPITFASQPTALLIASLAPLVVALASRVPNSLRPPMRAIPVALIIGLVITRVFDAQGSAWWYFYVTVPGANAMLFVSRIGLMMLIPAAIGLGLFVDTMLKRGRPLVALVVFLVCLMEQGVSNSTFDKFANRRVVSALASEIDPRADAFYYSPSQSSAPYYHSNIDAMWAGLLRGKPTVNGYSGGTPIGSRPLENSVINNEFDEFQLHWKLAEWRSEYGKSIGRISWIIGPWTWDLDQELSSE